MAKNLRFRLIDGLSRVRHVSESFNATWETIRAETTKAKQQLEEILPTLPEGDSKEMVEKALKLLRD